MLKLLGTGVVETALADTEEITVTINSAQNLMVVTCDRVHKCTQEDSTLVKLAEQIDRGFPESQYDLHEDLRVYHKIKENLHVVDGVVCYKGRLIIPVVLRQEVLDAIHAAHQGVSGMNNRVEQSVYWPGITVDLHNCKTCIRVNTTIPENSRKLCPHRRSTRQVLD